MKVIDLLNKIANGEEVPKKIKVHNNIYVYQSFNKLYWNRHKTHLLETYTGNILNDEIEIIEDTPKKDKKIEKIQLTNGGSTIHLSDFEDYNLTIINREIIKKLNEIIDMLNGDSDE